MPNDITRRRLLASTGLLASGLAVGGTATAIGRGERASRDELPLRWARTYDTNRVNAGAGVLERDDRYVVVGRTGSQNSQVGWLFAVDATTGEGQWQTTVENSDLDSQPTFQQIVPAVDGDGFVLLATSQSAGTISLVRTTVEGEVEWWEVYEPETSGGGSASLLAQDVVAVADGYVVGGYRVAGQTADAFTLRVDAEGGEQSRNRYFGDQTSTIIGLTQVGEAGYVAAGELQEQAEGQPPVRANLFRVDGADEIQWQREFTAEFEGDTTGQSQFRDVTPTENGFAVVGNAISGAGSSIAAWVVRVDGSGNGQAQGQLTPQSVTAAAGITTSDDGVVVAANMVNSSSGAITGWVGEVDDGVELNWNQSVSRADQTSFGRPIATSDGGIAVPGSTGTTSQNANPQSRALLAKLGGEPAPSVTDTGATTTDTTGTTTTSATPTATESTPEPTTAVTATPSPTPTASPTATPTGTTTSGNGPGFGVGTTVAALGAGALLHRVGTTADEEQE